MGNEIRHSPGLHPRGDPHPGANGFVPKDSGSSARGLHTSEGDVAQVYGPRGAIEGLAARLLFVAQPDLTARQARKDAMQQSAIAGNRERLPGNDLRFHLELCESSPSLYILVLARRRLLACLAFARLRVARQRSENVGQGQNPQAHQRIVDLLRDDAGEVGELHAKKAMAAFRQNGMRQLGEASVKWRVI
jgi:DNA-binding GntR family transcriptional regulator